MPLEASKGPKIRIDALICLTSSYGASSFFGIPSKSITPSFHFDFMPNSFNNCNINLVSARFGTFVKVKPLLIKRDKAIRGNAAFLAPLMLTAPYNWLPPVMKILSFVLSIKSFIIRDFNF